MIFKKLVSLILTLVMSVVILQHVAFAENALVLEGHKELSGEYLTDSLPDNNALADGFIRKIMSYDLHLARGDRIETRGSQLTGTARIFYDLLSADIAKVANGELSSTIFSYSMEDIYGKTEFTASELGITQFFDENYAYTEEGIVALVQLLDFIYNDDYDMNAVLFALQSDFPYEQYWHDKAKPTPYAATDDCGFSVSVDPVTFEQKLSIRGGIFFQYPVLADYALNGEQYVFNTTYGQNAKAAAKNARKIVANRAGSSDMEKLVGYAKDICDLTKYNDDEDALMQENGNLWQLIWVFDGDPETNVVCEGYAKAFKYLCDLSAFTGSISVSLASGTMSGGTGAGPHMWNIVRLDDGKNYLVDVTNIDEGTIGYPDQLLLAGYTSGSVEDGYKFTAGGSTIFYKYDTNMKTYFSTDELTIAKATVYKGMTCITLPGNVSRIESEALAGTNAQVIIIPAGCEYIAKDAFVNCAKLVYIVNRSALTITAPSGVNVIDEHE